MPSKEEYWRNPEKYRALCKQWRKDNVEKIKGYSAQYYQEHKEEYELNIIKYKLSSAKQRAKKNNLPFSITEQDIKDVWPIDNKCPALDIEFIIGGHDTMNYDSPSLDRIIPNKGYVKGNIQIVSALANGIMSNATPEQVIKVGQYFKKLIDNK
jgi:hypothetical protein